jgi:hypothetical protein
MKQHKKIFNFLFIKIFLPKYYYNPSNKKTKKTLIILNKKEKNRILELLLAS